MEAKLAGLKDQIKYNMDDKVVVDHIERSSEAVKDSRTRQVQ